MTFPNLAAAIRGLSHTGPRGFEGLVRELFAETTGQGFRLMKSGPQGGVDVIGDLTGSGLVVGVEGKHYQDTTRLPLDALKSKLRDAAERFPAMDLWVLAVSRAISGGDVAELEATADSLGVGVLVLDWDDGPSLPSLAVLCAGAPAAARKILGQDPACHADLAAIHADPAFAAEHNRLYSRLTDAFVGYGAARARCAGWISRHLRDADSARFAFDSYAALDAPGGLRIAREGLQAAMDAWWAQPDGRVAAILGEEGVGKTWGLLGWWLTASAADPDFPLTVVLPARRVVGVDGRQLLADAICQATGVRDGAFWRRRLDRWASQTSGSPPILVVLDALNQHWSFGQWSEVILSLTAGDWCGACAVAVTCRPDHWNNRLKGLHDLSTPSMAQSLGPFSDPELDKLLDLYALKRDHFEPRMLALLRVPRLCHLAIARRKELQDSGDITPERLVYEDWRHRGPLARQGLGHEEFRAFISGLGQRLRETSHDAPLTRTELLERLATDSGRTPQEFEGVLSELIDGRWLRDAGKPHRFQIDPSHAPYALGLALVDEVRDIPSIEEAEARIAEIFDPLQGLDIAVAILRSAATFATLDDVSSIARKALLSQWLGQQNFGPPDFQSFWRLIGCAPEVMLDVAEARWFGAPAGGAIDEVLVKGFSNAFRWLEVSKAVEARLTAWFSRFWLDPQAGEVLGPVAEDAEAAARRAETADRALAWSAEAPALDLGFEVSQHAPDHQAWGGYRAVELLSWLPLAPLIRPLTAWAVTAALLGRARQRDKVGWTLRWNPDDALEAEAAILERAEVLLGAGGAICREAALILLRALATPAARRRHDALEPPGDETAATARWDVDDVLQWGRCKNRPLEAVCALKADPRDPDLALSPRDAGALRHLADKLTPAQIGAAPDTLEDGGFETARDALARWAPDIRADLERRRFATPTDRAALTQWLPRALLALPDETVAAWRALAATRLAEGDWDTALQTVAMAGAEAAAQIAVLDACPDGELPACWTKLIAPPAADDYAALAARIVPNAPKVRLALWLEYLCVADLSAMPTGWAPLATLFLHDDAGIRTQAFRAAVYADQPAFRSYLAASEWRWRSDMDEQEAALGSLLLAYAPEAAHTDISARVHPQALGVLAKQHPDHAAYLTGFADHVRSELAALASDGSKTLHRTLFRAQSAWERLVSSYGRDLCAWLEPFVVETGPPPHHFLFAYEPYPLREALGAAEKLQPDLYARFVTRCLTESRYGPMRFGQLYADGCRIPGEAAEPARQFVLDDANDDQKLFDLAFELQSSGQSDRLLAQIDRDLAGPSAGLIARGLTLAGFLGQTAEAAKLWDVRLAAPPATGWLATVHERARARYRQHCWASHWARRYREASSDDEALAAHELLVAACDPRIYFDGVGRPTAEAMQTWSWRRRTHWSLRWPALTDAAKACKEAYKTQFLTSDPPLQRQRPRQR